MVDRNDIAGPERAALAVACAAADLDPWGAELISLGDSATFRLPQHIVGRVSRSPDQQTTARKEVAVARWLARLGVPAVRLLREPVQAGERTVTFWHELPNFRPATPQGIAALLVRLHGTVPPANFTLPGLAPFVRIAERVSSAPLPASDKDLLRGRLTDLQAAWPNATFELNPTVIHGDPHGRNLVATDDDIVTILDLERFSIGPPEWDLTLMASAYDSFRWITAEQYRTFVDTYGYDVLKAPSYPLLRDIRELRMTTWLANKASQTPDIAKEVRLRLECLRGERGTRPWAWTGF